jgi:glutamine amidotransferase
VCRHLAYLGEPVRLGELLVDPPHALYRQSWQPRRQHHGIMNVDGFGVGWYAEGDPVPARHRAAGPIWADPTFADLTRVVRSGAVLASIRSATAGMPAGPGAAEPFRHGRWLFSHNGALDGWPAAAAGLVARLRPEWVLALPAPSDAALLSVLTAQRLTDGAPLGEALAEVTGSALALTGGRVNLLVTDGTAIAATAAGASLSWRSDDAGVLVASEPHDDRPGWNDVPDGHLVQADREGVVVSAL